MKVFFISLSVLCISSSMAMENEAWLRRKTIPQLAATASSKTQNHAQSSFRSNPAIEKLKKERSKRVQQASSVQSR